MVDEGFGEAAVADPAEIGDANAEVPVRRAAERLIEPTGREKHTESREDVGTLDPRIAHETCVGVERLGSLLDRRLLVDRLDPPQVRSNHVEPPMARGGFASLQVGRAPSVIIVENRHEHIPVRGDIREDIQGRVPTPARPFGPRVLEVYDAAAGDLQPLDNLPVRRTNVRGRVVDDDQVLGCPRLRCDRRESAL